ncbi:hypothetical protein E3U23_00325 [Erythrobacter litoralis]|uniref:hypothetical protein n=1 Tax=Erythrobacter litoralis TaxID=39960 RepID=UPI002435F98C|nr:hypothetical protein [Erythrobacter litoralis]MDG6077643.1 hypothetical protein [Erythrobacter litoralis]
MTANARTRQIGWIVLLAVSFAALLALTFKVNAVKGQVRLVERQIVAAQQSKLRLETEFQTRASQQQLSDWNAVEFGYDAPRADQYVEHERQLAALGAPRGIDAPKPIRFAMAQAEKAEEPSVFDEWLGGEEKVVAERPSRRLKSSGGTLAQRLARPNAATLAAAEIGQ